MRLTKLSYVENNGTPKEWRLLEMTFESINLIVGRNSSGKSRVISILWNLATRISGLNNQPLGNGEFALEFELKDGIIFYDVAIVEGKVVREKYILRGELLLDRNAGGLGKIYYEKENKKFDFQSPENLLAVVNRQDDVQHSFLSHLIDWARGVFFLPFGTPLGRDNLAVIQEGSPEVDVRDANQAVGIYRRGDKRFPGIFKKMIIEDMKRIGYNLENIGVDFSEAIKLIGLPQRFSVLFVKEVGLDVKLEQVLISQGMFRALSALIQVNYGILSGESKFVMIDDIGEGLDYGRSCDLINLIVERIEGSSIQLLASTNDRFVMNNVNLKYWTVLDRQRNVVHPLNYRNSKEHFDNFKFTGLSNFDFLARGFFRDEAQ